LNDPRHDVARSDHVAVGMSNLNRG
jgi:hypothetical protein